MPGPLHQNTDDCSGHARREGAGNDSSDAEAHDFVTSFGLEAAKAANQDAEAAEIREAGKRVRHDQAAAGIQGVCGQLGHVEKSEQFVQDGFRPHQIASRLRLRPWNSKEPYNGRHDEPQNPLKRERLSPNAR